MPKKTLDKENLQKLGSETSAGLVVDLVQGSACAFLDETEQPVGVLSTIYDRDSSSEGRHEATGRLNRLYAHSILRSLGFRDPN